MENYEQNYSLTRRIQSELSSTGTSYIRNGLVDVAPQVKPSLIELVARGEPALTSVKTLLREYYDHFFEAEVPTPSYLQGILDRVQGSLRFVPTQPLYFKETEGIRQFAVYWPWGLYGKEYAATVVFLEIPKEWNGSSPHIAAGIGGKLARAGLLD